MTDGFDRQLLRGFADLAASNPDARDVLRHRPDGSAYTASEHGIYLDSGPAIDGPSVTLAWYAVDDHPALADSVSGVQVTLRDRDRARLSRVSDDLFRLFHGRYGGTIGPVRLVSARRASATNLGQDSNGRQGRSENYYLTVHRPSPHRL